MTDEKKIPDEKLKDVDGGATRFNPDGPDRTSARPYGTGSGRRPKPSWADEDGSTGTTADPDGSQPKDFDPSGN